MRYAIAGIGISGLSVGLIGPIALGLSARLTSQGKAVWLIFLLISAIMVIAGIAGKRRLSSVIGR